MDPAAAKQQIVERVKQASNILVTVSNNPSVDQLAACIGLTLLLNKMDKHATAVFSGQVPSTIEFLQPKKTIETNTDSLQDFIISLDKNKADKLRYKVEDDVVRIFITPYRTSLSKKDLIFSQGDFNVEVVMALGVKDRSQLDKAITAHGRILHDATVVSVNAGNDKAAELGQINWQDPTASSLSEMLVSISEAFGTGLIDNQMATAFLTGIVAETARFSNDKTSPKVMTMSAQLMAAGANQQLIVSKLEPPKPRPPDTDGRKPVAKKPPAPKAPPPTGVLNVSHEPEKISSEEVEVKAGEIHIDERGNIVSSEAEAPPSPPQSPAPVIQTAPMAVMHPPEPAVPVQKDNSPLPGPHTLLDPTDHQPAINPPFTADTSPQWSDHDDQDSGDPLGISSHPNDAFTSRETVVQPPKQEILTPAQMTATAAPLAPTVNTARSAVESALDEAPFDPAEHPIAALSAQPISQPLHETSLNPPPPVPPPLMPTPSLRIPDQGQNKK
jgi:hypothetical protein